MNDIRFTPETQRQLVEMIKGLISEAKEMTVLDEKTLVNEARAAEILDLAKGTLTVWRHQGKGPRYVKLEGAIRYKYLDLLDYIDQQSKGEVT